MQAGARHPVPVLVIAAFLTALAALGASQVEPQVDFVDAVPDNPDLHLYRRVLSELDGVRFAAIYMAHEPASGTPDLRSDAGFDALVRDQENLTQHVLSQFAPGTFSHTLSVYEAMRAGNHMYLKFITAGNPPDGSYALPQDPISWQRVRDEARTSSNDVLAADGHSALALFFFATPDNLHARQLAGDVAHIVSEWSRNNPEAHPATTHHQTTGFLYASHYTDQRNQDDLPLWGFIATATVLAALLVAVRRPGNVLVATTSVLVAILWTFGLMGAAGVRISFLTVFLVPLVAGVGVDYAVHVLHRYEEERSMGRGRREALAQAVSSTGRAVTLAALTTTAGLLILGLVPNPLFAQIGLVSALGVLMGFVTALTVAPAMRAVLPERRRHNTKRRDTWGTTVARIGHAFVRRPRLVAGTVVALTIAAAAVVATQTTVESGASDNEFPADDPVLQLQQRIEKEYGAFQRAYLVVAGDIAQPTTLAAIHTTVQDAGQLPLALEATSVTNLLIADGRTDQGSLDVILGAATQADDASYLPRSPEDARQALAQLFADPLWRSLAPFTITRDLDLAVVAIRLQPTHDQGDLLDLRNQLTQAAQTLQSQLGPQYQVAATGTPLNRAAVVEQTPTNVTIATLGTAGVVAAILGTAWGIRRGREGLRVAALAVAVVLVAATWLLASIPLLDAAHGTLHRWGAPANSASLTDMFLLAFAITVALGVDDVVHIAHRFWEYRDQGQSRPEALDGALRHAGRAISATSLTTFAAFAPLAGAYFLQSKNLAILTALGVVYAYVLTLALVPWALARGTIADETPTQTGTTRPTGASVNKTPPGS